MQKKKKNTHHVGVVPQRSKAPRRQHLPSIKHTRQLRTVLAKTDAQWATPIKRPMTKSKRRRQIRCISKTLYRNLREHVKQSPMSHSK